MLLGEPPKTQYDLRFVLAGIPVRVHPLFWLVAVLLGMPATGGEPVAVFQWVGVVFVSILVHEFGHALAARSFGYRPWVTLYSLGGLASYQPTRDMPTRQIVISAAGPAAGFLLASLIIAAVMVSGQQVSFLYWTFGSGPPVGVENANVRFVVFALLFVNVFWGLINLLPVYPLDGGQIAREVLTIFNPREGIKQSLWLSVLAGGGAAVYGLMSQQMYLGLMFGFLAYQSYSTLQAYSGSGGSGGGYGGPRGW